jgi:uncharacterized protein YjbI with pentapeptide repeats
VEPKKPALGSKSGSEKRSALWRPTKRQVLWAIGMVVALLTAALLIVNLRPAIWKGLLEERDLTLIAIGVSLAAIIVLLAIGGATRSWTGFRGKTVWDLLQLLIVPLALAVLGLWFAAQQDARQQQIENQRAEAERELAVQRAQDEALQAYLDQMGSLLLGNGLRDSEEGSEERTLARARTLTVLERLDPERRSAVLQFLVEAGLVQSVEERAPLIELRGANLRKVDLSNADLSEADLTDADLSAAELSNADLTDADLTDANVSNANLRQAELSNANLVNANLSGTMLLKADLSEADLTDANLSRAYLRRPDLSRANLRYADLSEANLHYADLSRADLSEADLSGTYLSHANLFHASLSDEPYLSDANLSGANLSEANLYRARGITKEQLEKQTSTLEGATMPDGTVVFSAEFEPPLSFSLSEEWYEEESQIFAAEESPDFIFRDGPEGGALLFTNPLHVFDPSDPSKPKELPAPENAEEWVSWFQSHPNLDTSKPVPASVGDASGKRIDVTVTSRLENFVPLYPLSDGSIIAVYYEGSKDRFVIVDVGGKTVLIDVFAPPDKFDEFLSKAQKVLDTVEWKGE